ncbi:hypothetical protein AEMCBJ_04340 [Cupriavidus necator]
MTREDPQMKLRLPTELKEKLAAAAAESGRSINAEVVSRLAASFEKADAEGVVDFLLKETKTLGVKLDLVMRKLEGKPIPPSSDGERTVKVIRRKR